MDNLLELRDGNSHALGCAQAMLDGTKDIDGKEAKRIVREMADWKKLSSRLLCEEPAAYVEIAVEMEFDPCEVARYITDTFEGLVIEASEGRLCALSAYLLDALDADGQTRLQKIASNGNLMDRLPRGLLSHLLKDCAKLGAKHPKQAKYLNKRLNSALESKKRKFNK
ncbi:hypothetical protein PAPHI01_1417 [Pancytospora philotis]|nr:hypothetical protein PAPHI01_1417 [Pancytospora philotis]